ncbi:hypothetical protein GS887_26820 [Rhodococcus hoagii]|nr:hypothetical protein [Prescottella equi]
MGYYVNSRGTITLATAVLDEVWETLQVASAENLVDVSAADRLEDWASAADKIAVVVADVLGSTCPPDAFHRSGDASEVELQVWADGKLGEALEVFEILAAHGATGEIEAVGEDYSRWRWRWADGVVHDESARTIYDGQVDTEGWVVQMQSLDDHDFDHIALVACEAAGKVLIAQWCRDEYAAHPSCMATVRRQTATRTPSSTHGQTPSAAFGTESHRSTLLHGRQHRAPRRRWLRRAISVDEQRGPWPAQPDTRTPSVRGHTTARRRSLTTDRMPGTSLIGGSRVAVIRGLIS